MVSLRTSLSIESDIDTNFAVYLAVDYIKSPNSGVSIFSVIVQSDVEQVVFAVVSVAIINKGKSVWKAYQVSDNACGGIHLSNVSISCHKNTIDQSTGAINSLQTR